MTEAVPKPYNLISTVVTWKTATQDAFNPCKQQGNNNTVAGVSYTLELFHDIIAVHHISFLWS